MNNPIILLIIKIMRKIAYFLEQNILSNYDQIPEGIEIDSSSTLPLSHLKLKKNCIIKVNRESQVGGSLIFERDNASVLIGQRTFMQGSIIAAEKVEIGDDVMIAWGVTIIDHNSHSIYFSQRAQDVINWKVGKKDWTHVKIAPVKICNKVWIGFNSIILKGVTLGEGSIVGAGSVVTKDVPPWTVVAGNPAQVIKRVSESKPNIDSINSVLNSHSDESKTYVT